MDREKRKGEGTTAGHDSHIDIRICVDEEGLSMHVSNPIFKETTLLKAGTGIENCRRRLALIYPDRHQLDIDEHDGLYTVILNIKL